ncbi:arginine--tRNA ligase [Candidatus Woesearchaeota archaeon CG10_big_fil_rev_8_21_14_0_10_45_16]|nr:MAG: arginine--tRNA ligase [Candidatus Woesearchaeota archaeon CG10_big_fil_rev_8_21_14_0_10_45_16]
MDFKQEIISLLSKKIELPEEKLQQLLTVPPDSKLGDFAFPCFSLGKNPKEAAEKLKEKIELPEYVTKIEVAGPYLNFFLNPSSLAEATLTSIYKQAKTYGGNQAKGKRIVIEYCGPNTNKPLHLGHLRNMALGNAVCRILSFYGHTVIPVNIINDRGVHICQSMLAYQRWGGNKEPDKKGDHFVGDYYVMFSKAAKEDPALQEEAQELLVKWENNDPETRKLWQQMNSYVLNGFSETYKRFGIKFDKEYFESQYYSKGKEMVMEGLEQGIFQKDAQGSIIAPLEDQKLPDKILLRANGTSIYITQDMYLADMRYADFKYSQMIYVVASEQRLHFQQLFAILKKLRKPYAENMYHLSYGLVHLPSGRMKSREGTVVDADDVMDETSALAKEEILKRHEGIEESECLQRAEAISLAAIKFFMTRTDPIKDIVFNPEESLSFEGETGPYVQYAHARICSILRKAQSDHQQSVVLTVNFSLFTLEEEQKLLKLLASFPEIVEKSASSCKPHHLANYLVALAQSFNEFYHKCPVLSDMKNQTKARLLLVDSTRQVLENGLGLLGITAPEEM